MEIKSGDGTRLVARVAGQGVPVVFVHGSSGGLDSWDPVLSALGPGFETWVYARRGYAPSDEGVGPKTYAQEVDDLQAVIAAAGGSAHVVGGSHGSTVALHTALTDPSAIRSLALFEPPLFAAGPKLADLIAPFRSLLAAGNLTSANRLFAERVAQVPPAILDAAFGPADTLPADTPSHSPREVAEAVGCLHDLEAMVADTTDLARWSKVESRVLLMQGADTWTPMPETMDALATALPNVTRVIWPGQSHFASHAAPELFAAALRDFFTP